MKITPDIEKKIQDTLDSLDAVQRAEPKPYFYARLNARLSHSEKSKWEYLGAFLSKPAVVVAGLFLVLIMNLFILMQDNAPAATSPTIVSSTEQTVGENDNIIASSSSFDYENIDQ